MQSVRETKRESLLLDSGDLFFDRYRKEIRAEDVTAQSEKAHLILKCYNLLVYDAMGIGDDDLSLGKDFLVDLSKNASFPFISSNLMDKETGEALFKTHVIKETGGLRIGIFSLLSPYFFSVESDQESCFASPLRKRKEFSEKSGRKQTWLFSSVILAIRQILNWRKPCRALM